MADEEKAETPEVDIAELVREKLQEILNENSSIGAQVVTDFVLVAEVHTGESPYLRIIDSDLPPWRRHGLLAWTTQNDLAEMAGGHAWAMSMDAQDGEDA